MGVLRTPFGHWSEGAQDEVDDFLRERYSRALVVAKTYKGLPKSEQRKILPLLMGVYKKAIKDKALFARFRSVYWVEAGTPAS